MAVTHATHRDKPWRDDDWLRRMIDEGRTTAEMADIAGCSRSTICLALRDTGMATDGRRRQLSRKDMVLPTRWTERGKPWRDPNWLRAMRHMGLSYRQMAKTAGCSNATIVTAMANAGLAGQPAQGAPLEAPWQRPRTDPVCDPDLCPGWDDCLDDADALCAWHALLSVSG